MKSISTLSFVLSLMVLFSVPQLFAQNNTGGVSHQGTSPLNYVANHGQWHENVAFKANFGQHVLFVEDGGFTYLLTHADDLGRVHEAHNAKPSMGRPDIPIRHHAYRVRFAGPKDSSRRSEKTKSEGIAKRRAYHNYFLGNDESKWAAHVPLYGKVVQKDIYEGIHLETYSQSGSLKYDLLVQPGADASQIRMEYEGADRLELSGGELHIHTSVDVVREMPPVAWQEHEGRRHFVKCEYVLEGKVLSFHFPEGYDEALELVIDPTVVAATLSGTTSSGFGHTATFDNAGNIYAGGISFEQGYPTTMGAFQTNFAGGYCDISVSKYSPEGADLIYATYIGGVDADYPHSMITDFNQQLYVYGSTSSTNYPVTANAVQPDFGGGAADAVVSILSPDGSALVGSSYFGGSQSDGQNESSLNANYGDTFRGEIVLDNQNNVYVVSCSGSADFPVTGNAFDTSFNPVGGFFSPAQDVVVFKSNSDLSLLYWSTFMGGENADIGNGIRVDDSYNVYVTGTAGNDDFPTTAGTNQPNWPGQEENAYLVKLSADGSSMLAGTFFGTPDGDEHSYFLDVDEDDNVHIYGQTTGTVPITPGTYSAVPGSRQFLAAFNADLTDIVYSTVIGTNSFPAEVNFVPVAFMVDKCNGIYFSGYYGDAGLPTTPDAISTLSDAIYLGVLTPNATDLSFGTYYGDADHVDGGTSRFDKSGVVYQAVCSCSSNILNTLPNAWATFQTGFCDVGVFKIDFEIETVIANGIALPSTSGCAPYTVDFEFTGTNATTFEWLIDGALVSTDQSHNYTFANSGAYDVQLIVSNPAACNPTDTLNLQIDVLDGESTSTDTTICGGNNIFLDATTANATYEWQDGSTVATYVVDGPGVYWVDVNIGTCARRDSFMVASASGVIVDIGNDMAVCDVPSITLDATDPGIASYLWQNNSTSPTLTATGSGLYIVEAIDTAGCTSTDEVELSFGTTPQVELGADSTLCVGNSITLLPVASGGTPTWQDGSTGGDLSVGSPGIYWVEFDDNGCVERDSVQIEFYPELVVNATGIDILCANDCNGIVNTSPQGGGGGAYQILWGMGDTTSEVDSLCPADYSVTVTDGEGCTGEGMATVGAPPPLEMLLTLKHVECPGDNDGAIEVTEAEGGVPPYLYAVANGGFSELNGAGLLPGGDYEVVVKDANGCTLTQTATVEEPQVFSVSAGEDIEMNLGEMVRLNGQVGPYFGQDLNWSPSDFLDFDDILNPSLMPTQTTEYQFLVTDPASGCFELDTVLVRVLKPRNVYIPNAFSPNGDGANDYFTVFGGISVERITEFRIFDRWGEQVYEFYNLPPNIPELGWDGTLNGEEMNPAVFTYMAFVEFKDGEVIFYKGDFTLVK